MTGLGSPIANLVVAGLVAEGDTENPPWVAMPAAAAPSTVSGTTTQLNVLGGDDYDAAALIYTWSVVSEPNGATAPTFSVNSNNTAQNTTVTFHDAGNYVFAVTITNIYGLSVTSDVNVTVNQTVSGVTLTPASGNLNDNSTLQFTATAYDQFGHSMTLQPSWNWSLAGGGSINGSGLYTAPQDGSGTATIYVNGEGITQAVTVSFTAVPSSNPPAPGQILSIWLEFIESWMSQLTQFQSMWQLLVATLPNQSNAGE